MDEYDLRVNVKRWGLKFGKNADVIYGQPQTPKPLCDKRPKRPKRPFK